MGDDPRPALGRLGEQLAAEHLERLGFRILERNFRNRWGELDIVAYDGRVIAFCEVKSRRTGGREIGGTPFDAVHPSKQMQVRRMAGHWLTARADRPYAEQLRFDAIGITFDRSGRLLSLEHLEGAF